MEKINTILVDDEINNLTNLRSVLTQYCPDINIVAEATNADLALQQISRYNPDLLFLDIQMPGKNGFDLLNALPHNDLEVILVTAFDQYGIQAIKLSAIDYLLKPVNVEELIMAVSKAKQRLESRKRNWQLENLLLLMGKRLSDEKQRIALHSMKETRLVEIAQIIRCEASNNYTRFFLMSGEELVVSKPIYEYEELLGGYGFVRCHQRHLVNKNFVKSIIKEAGGSIILHDNTSVPISRQKKELIKKMLLS
jgi:two-component system, LytTR family, response regulator